MPAELLLEPQRLQFSARTAVIKNYSQSLKASVEFQYPVLATTQEIQGLISRSAS